MLFVNQGTLTFSKRGQKMTLDLHRLMQSAVQFMSSGQVVSSELACYDILSIDPRSDLAFNILGIIASRIGRKDLAIPYLERALKYSKNRAAIQRNLDFAKASTIPDIDQLATEPRYLLSKAWGQGFWSDVGHVLGCLLLAEITNRIPVVEWGAKCLYGNGQIANAFDLYFNKISAASFDDFSASPSTTYFPAKWNWTNITTSLPFSPNDRPEAPLELMQRRERVIVIDTYMPILGLLPWLRKSHPLRGCTAQQTVSYLVKRYLSPKQHILDECMKFWHEQFDQKPFHCIHLRGLDKGVEAANFEELNQQCISNLDEADQSLPILVLTDDANIYREMSSRYGSRAIFTSSTRGSGKTGIHLLEGAKGQSLGQEIMFDSYLATFADRFIGVASSNVATMISYLKDWPQGHCTLVGSSALTSLSIFSGYISAKAAVISALPMPLQGNIWKLAED